MTTLALACGAAQRTPAWLTGAAASDPAAASASPADTLILLNEETISVDRSAQSTRRTRFALRVLRREGRKQATATVPYIQGSDRLASLNAWLVKPDGSVRTFDRRRVIDVAAATDALYSEQRVAVIDLSDEADTGDVVGWESEIRRRLHLGQGLHMLQQAEPALVSRLTIATPEGWAVDVFTRNREAIVPIVGADSRTWELTDLPACRPEPFGPEPGRLMISLGYDIRPPATAGKSLATRSFQSWAEVAAFANELHTAPARPDPSIDAAARRICAGSTGVWEQVRALARHVQDLRYVSIAMDLGRSGGFTPHPAPEVLRCGYGDCKDKTTLLRALLATRGIESYPVLCYSGDPRMVHDGWPSPLQFNHVFAGIVVDGSVDSPFVLDVAGVGRMLLFDPTDRHTSPGDFPGTNQGARVLVCAPGQTGLLTVPVAPAAFNLESRQVEVTLQAGGGIRARLHEEARGSPAASRRAQFSQSTAVENVVTSWLRESIAGARVDAAKINDDMIAGTFGWNTEFSAGAHGRRVGTRLLVFRPVLFPVAPEALCADGPRSLPIVIPAASLHEETEFLLPDGYTVVEGVTPVGAETSFGRYEAAIEITEGKLVLSRSLTLRPDEMEPGRAEEVRRFFRAIRAAEGRSIVLEQR